jgi:hypothetical protein
VTGWRWAGGVLLLVAAVAACQEQLTAPADCPALCPGGTAEIFDTIVPALQDRDSSFPAFVDRASGYVDRGKGTALLVSNGFAASEDRAVYRFAPRGGTVALRDTLRTYAVDSVLVSLALVARDTLVNGLKVYLYRLPEPETVDSTRTFADIDALLTDANLIDSISVPDSVNAGAITTTFRGADAAKLGLAPGGDSVLAIGLRIAAETPTGIRVGALASSTAASFTSYVTLDVPDTGATRKQSLTRSTVFNTFVTQNPVVPDDTLLTVGGEPSSRALLRFALSNEFLDSTTIVRATLELTPVRPILGLPTDPSVLHTIAVVGDLGAKSPLTTDLSLVRQDTLPAVQSDTVQVEVTRIVQFWQSARSRPQSVFLRLMPEAATFARAVFHSTRSHVPDGMLVAPRLRITYQRSFPFENP